jgi:hypothetical protein
MLCTCASYHASSAAATDATRKTKSLLNSRVISAATDASLCVRAQATGTAVLHYMNTQDKKCIGEVLTTAQEGVDKL